MQIILQNSISLRHWKRGRCVGQTFKVDLEDRGIKQMVNLVKFRKLHFTEQESSEEEMEEKKEKT